jgi:hypothetical protein
MCLTTLGIISKIDSSLSTDHSRGGHDSPPQSILAASVHYHPLSDVAQLSGYVH